jgi:L-serine dehydratase
MFSTVAELASEAENRRTTLAEVMISHEIAVHKASREDIWARMEKNLDVMQAASARGVAGEGVFSRSGLTGGEAVLLKKYRETKKTLSGDAMVRALQNAVATNEVNAAMGVVCATPTAGSTGTLPGILFSLSERFSLSREQQVNFLFCAGACGLVIANNASISGAVGGCQAEVGSASAMGAAAATEIMGGSPAQAAEALAIALSNLLGLVCDPVAGLVELPCVKRNAIGACNALIAADMALAGCANKIPADEVIATMHSIGSSLPSSLRETGIGGLAGTPTARGLAQQLLQKVR